MHQKEVTLAYRFLNRINHINLIENSEILPLEHRKFVWYKIYSRNLSLKRKKKPLFN